MAFGSRPTCRYRVGFPPLLSLSVAVVLLYALLAMTMRGCLPSSSVLPPRPSGVDGAFV